MSYPGAAPQPHVVSSMVVEQRMWGYGGSEIPGALPPIASQQTLVFWSDGIVTWVQPGESVPYGSTTRKFSVGPTLAPYAMPNYAPTQVFSASDNRIMFAHTCKGLPMVEELPGNRWQIYWEDGKSTLSQGVTCNSCFTTGYWRDSVWIPDYERRN